MSLLICPVCKEKLNRCDNSLKCINNHCFDVAKQGYVNLLQSQKKSNKRHGDDKLMVDARKSFLDKGFYEPLLNKTYEFTDKYAKNGFKILDAGCGEGYYTANIYNHLMAQNISTEFCGIDIAKDALISACKRNKDIEYAVASVFDMPVANNSVDLIFNFFAPNPTDEYKRILNKNGILIRAVPLKLHLWELKCSIYDNVYENDETTTELDGFELIDKNEVKYIIDLKSNDDIKNLFKMTPYYYKTSRNDQAKVSNMNSLITKVEFGIYVYKAK